MRKELTQLKENLEEKEEEFKSVCEENRKLRQELEVVNVEKKKSEDELKKFEEDIDQVVRIMEEKEQFISNLKRQMQELEDEHKTKLESCEREIDKLKWNIEELENMHDEFKGRVASTWESMAREHEDHVDGLEEECNELGEIIGDKVWEIEDLKSALQNSEKEFFHGQVEELSEETVADKQKGFNDQFYTLTGNISSESDNESYVPLEEERKSLRSSSIDDGYGSDKENCGNNLPSSIGSDISIERVAKSRNVGSSPPLC